MFANLLNLISRRPGPDDEAGFVREVKVRERRPRHPGVERLIWICWGLIAIKTPLTFWAVRYFHIPFNAYWVVAPTIVGAAIITAIYYWRR